MEAGAAVDNDDDDIDGDDDEGGGEKEKKEEEEEKEVFEEGIEYEKLHAKVEFRSTPETTPENLLQDLTPSLPTLSIDDQVS